MTKLDCSVTGCMHNAENCCCKNTILVEGKTAQDKCDTCCGSFDEKKGGTFRNLFKTPENRLEVECEATNCVYNTDRRCSAEHIVRTGFKRRSVPSAAAAGVILPPFFRYFNVSTVI